MDAVAKRKWIRALKGQNKKKYSQTRYGLKDEKGFCCLGVLCDIINPDKWKMVSENAYKYGNSFSGKLPIKLRKEIGLTPKEEKELIDLNDNREYDFQTIAEHIKKNIPGE